IALNIHLSVDRLERSVGQDDLTIDDYDQWLIGQQLIMDDRPESWDRAMRLFQGLVERQPRFSRGHSGLAQAIGLKHVAFPGIFSDEESRAASFHHSRRAIELDPLDSRSQLCMGWGCAMLGQYERAEIAFELAHKNNENDPWTIVSAAVGLAFCDRLETASELSKVALSIDLNPSKAQWSYQAVIFFITGDYERCVHACQLGQDIFPDTRSWHVASLIQLGDCEQAKQSLLEFLTNTRENWLGSDPPSDHKIARWLVNCYPFRSSTPWLCFAEGLTEAGLKMPLLEHAEC
ncbi:MAG: hypothetical protein AAF870_05235, partial [Pseudomonadota bacterium]